MNDRSSRLITYRSGDGLKLVARAFGPQIRAQHPPVLCLAGLTRNGRDFHSIATQLAASRRVIVPDYRGRGLSDYCAWQLYTPQVELQDILVLLQDLGLSEVDIIGTSRGGIIAMLMAMAAPMLIRRCVLNDIGPVIEADGLIRIKGHVGRQPAPDWAKATAELALRFPEFTGLSREDWLEFARRLYRDDHGRPVLDYDPLLANTLPDEASLRAGLLPALWQPFDALAARPVLVIRGAASDLLSPLTLRRMVARHHRVAALTIPGRGHAPFLDEPDAAQAIVSFLS